MAGRPVIFLDRDGVLCEERGYVSSLWELRIFPYAQEAVERLHALGYLVIVITNQSAVARGLTDEKMVEEIHRCIMRETGVDKIYYCPHLPPKQGEPPRPPYHVFCDCRKPRTGLIGQAMRDYALNMERAYFAGDRASDIETGQAAGISTILLESGYGMARLEKTVKPDLVFETLMDFTHYLEQREKRNRD